MSCILCLKNVCPTSGNIALASVKAESLGIKDIIEKHFWLQVSTTSINSCSICGQCWEQLFSFHQFYLRVEIAHKELEAKNRVRSEDENVEKCAPAQIMASEMVVLQIKDEIELKSPTPPPVIKRKRGRPRRQPVTEIVTEAKSNMLKEVMLEEINLNEIKIELPEADLSMEDVLNDNIDDEGETRFEFNLEATHESEEAQHKRNSIVTKRKRPERRSSDIAEKSQKTLEFNKYIEDNIKLYCSVCNDSLSDFTKLLHHYRKEHKQQGYAFCCGKKFFKRGLLVDHLHLHKDPAYFKCKICDQILGERRSLELHIRMHNIKEMGRSYKCLICSKSYFNRVVFMRHKQTHVPDEDCKFACKQCDKNFPTKYTMEQHFGRVHLNLYAKICDICGKSIQGKEALIRHMQEHESGERQLVQCDICGTSLTTKNGLTRHKKMMHTEENRQPIQCPICLKISPSLQAHNTHIKYTHKSERKHRCPLCEKAFRRPNELREHMTTHTGDTLYTCPHCPKTFNSNANMHSHRKKVHRQEWEEYRQQRNQLISQGKKSTTSIISISEQKTASKILVDVESDV